MTYLSTWYFLYSLLFYIIRVIIFILGLTSFLVSVLDFLSLSSISVKRYSVFQGLINYPHVLWGTHSTVSIWVKWKGFSGFSWLFGPFNNSNNNDDEEWHCSLFSCANSWKYGRHIEMNPSLHLVSVFVYQVALYWRCFCFLGDIWQHLKTFSVVATGEI